MSRPKNTWYFLNSVIAVAIMLFFRFLPPIGSMTPLGMAYLGIFIGLVWAWVSVDMIWPSVFALVLMGLLQSETGGVVSVLTQVISNPVVQMLLWLLVYSAILTTSGISEQLACRLISLRICKGHPWILTIMIYAASLICSAFGSGFAVVLVCWNLVYSIAESAGYTRHDKWPRMAIIAVVIGCVHGLAGMPFQAAVVGAFGYLAAASGGTIVAYNYAAFILFACIFFVVGSAIYFLLCRFIVRPDMTKLKDIAVQEEIRPFTKKQRIALALLAALFLYMVVQSLLPEGVMKSFLDGIGLTPFVLLLIASVIFLRDKNGAPLFAFAQLAKEGVIWPMIFMIGTAVFMGGALSGPNTGFTETIISAFEPFLLDASPFVFCVIVIIAASIITNLLSNAVASAILISVVYPFAALLGLNPILLVILIIHATEMGLLLPCSSPNGALLYSNQEWLDAPDIVKQSIYAILSTIIALIILIEPGMMLFPAMG